MPAPQIPLPIIVTDTREKRPFQFAQCHTEVRKLDTGDYSIDGLTHRVSIERKSIPDFIGSVTRSRARFMKEVKRLAEMKREHAGDGGHLVAIIVEGTLRDIQLTAELQGVSYKSLFATAASLHASWGIPVIFCYDRHEAACYTEELLIKFNQTATKRGLSRT